MSPPTYYINSPCLATLNERKEDDCTTPPTAACAYGAFFLWNGANILGLTPYCPIFHQIRVILPLAAGYDGEKGG